MKKQAGKTADSKTTPAPGAKEQSAKTTAASTQKIASGETSGKAAKASGSTPAPSKQASAESAPTKAKVVAKASPSHSPVPAQKSVAKAPTATPAPAKVAESATESTLDPVADGPKKKRKKRKQATVAKATPTPTPAPSTPDSRVAAKPSPTPPGRKGNLSLDTHYTDMRISDSRSAQPSTKSLTSLTPSTASTRSTNGSGLPLGTGSNVVAGRYPWRTNIVTTVFWIGEPVGGHNFTPNVSSSWDSNWTRNYGGFDNPNPEARRNYIPAKFIPRQNPFYVALPYNDVTRGTTKPESRVVIPWFREAFRREGQSVCRDRWVAVRNRAGRVAYAQWSDCGPFRTDHWQYVFGMERPRPNLNQGAGLDVSPAMRDYLGLQSTDVTDWKFVEAKDVPNGPWALYGDNNTFVQRRTGKADMAELVSRGR